MIKTIQLRNFQAHRKFRLELDPGITTIRGRTDAGKSSILRAFRWAALNIAPGGGFIRRGQKTATVSVWIRSPKGQLVRIDRRRGGQNLYRVNGRVLRSFGSRVPDAAARWLRVNEINFQRQHDAPFWLADSSGEVARQLNRVIDLSVIDSSHQYVTRRLRTAKERVAIFTEGCEEKERRWKELDSRKHRIQLFREISRDYVQLAQWEKTRTGIARLIQAAWQVDLEKAEARERSAGELADLGRRLRIATRQRSVLIRLIREAADARKRSRIDFPAFAPIEVAYREYKRVWGQLQAIAGLFRNAQDARRTINRAEKAAQRLGARLGAERCPLCGK